MTSSKYFSLKKLTILGLATAALLTTNQAQAGDAAKGERLYRACAVCHSVDEGVNKVGPSLYNIMGLQAATIEGYRYSKAMKAYGAEGNIWNEENMDVFLTSPRKAVPRTKMGYPGMRKAEDRKDLIAYLLTLSSGSE